MCVLIKDLDENGLAPVIPPGSQHESLPDAESSQHRTPKIGADNIDVPHIRIVVASEENSQRDVGIYDRKLQCILSFGQQV